MGLFRWSEEKKKKIFEEGYASYKRKDYVTASKVIIAVAKQGYHPAQHLLGIMYHFGCGVPQDYGKALRWFQKAARQGNSLAQFFCGVHYEKGYDMRGPLPEKAVYWYEKSARQGYDEAQNILAVCYGAGRGIEKDYTKALEWFLKAAEQNNLDSQFFCGYIYENGLGLEPDFEKALYWYEKAALQGKLDAQCACAEMYRKGDGTVPDPEKAIYWYEKSFEQKKSPEALYQCGLLYMDVPIEDTERAVYCLAQAVEQGSKEAAKELGKLRLQADIYQILIKQWHIEKEKEQPGKGKSYTENQPGEATKKVAQKFSCRYSIFRQYLPAEFLSRAYQISLEIGRQNGFWPFILSVNESTAELSPENLAEDLGSVTIDCKDNGQAVLKKRYKRFFEEQGLSLEEFMGNQTSGESQTKFTSYINSKSDKLKEDLLLLEIPVKNPWEIVGWLGINVEYGVDDVYYEELMSICKYWYEKYQAFPAVYDGSDMEFCAPARLNGQDSIEVAKEHFALACFNIMYFTSSRGLLEYAAGLEDSTVWHFTWNI